MPSSDNVENRSPDGAQSSHAESSASAGNGRAHAVWEAYFQTHPWLTCGTAAALAYLLVPRGRPKEESARTPRPDDSETPIAETTSAGVASENLAKDLLKLAAATAAEQAVAQTFVLARELLDKSPAAKAQLRPSVDHNSAAADAGPAAEQAAETIQREMHWVEEAIKNLNLPAVEKQLEHVATEHPVTSLVTAATVGLLVGVALKR